MKQRLYLFCFSLIFIFIGAKMTSTPTIDFDGQPEVVQAKLFLSRDGVHPGEIIALALKLEIAPGWHINAPEQIDPFIIPCSLEISESPDYQTIDNYYPPAERGKFPFSENELAFYAGEVYLGVLFKVSDNIRPGKIKIRGHLTYQACDDTSCLAPETLPLEAELEIVSPEQPTKEINSEIFAQIKFRLDKGK